VLVVSVRLTVDEPSGCSVVVCLVSVLSLFPVAVLVEVSVWVVVVDAGGVLLPQATRPSVEAINSAVVVNRRRWCVMPFDSCKRGPVSRRSVLVEFSWRPVRDSPVDAVLP
jgi:hypothetical protein